MKQNFRTILHIFLGILFIMIGIFGLVLPILNGTLLILVGCIIISFENPYLQGKLFTLTQKSKIVHSMYLKLEKLMRKIFRI